MLRSVSAFVKFSGKVNPRVFFPSLHHKQAFYSSNPEYENENEPYEVFRNRFLNAFNDPNLDGWWVRKWMQNLHLEDAVPPPEVVASGLKACRRLNDFALAIRFLEAVKVKCDVVNGAWDWMQQELEPTTKELGLPKLKDLGYEEPELFLPHYDDH